MLVIVLALALGGVQVPDFHTSIDASCNSKNRLDYTAFVRSHENLGFAAFMEGMEVAHAYRAAGCRHEAAALYAWLGREGDPGVRASALAALGELHQGEG